MTELTVTVVCECGAEHVHDTSEGKLECECGARYAVTLTQLRPPQTSDVEEDPADTGESPATGS